MKITIDLPEDVIKILNIPEGELSSELKIHRLLYIFMKRENFLLERQDSLQV